MTTMTPTPQYSDKKQVYLMKESDISVIKKKVILLITILGEEKLQLSQKVLVKTITVKEKSNSFQSRGKEPISFFKIYTRGFILRKSFYYSVYTRQ